MAGRRWLWRWGRLRVGFRTRAAAPKSPESPALPAAFLPMSQLLGIWKISSLRAPEDPRLRLLRCFLSAPPSLPSYSHQGSSLTGASEAPASVFLTPCFVRKLQLATGTGRMSDYWKQQAPRRDKKRAPVCPPSAPTVTGQATAGEMARRRWPRGAGAHRLGAPRGGGFGESCVFWALSLKKGFPSLRNFILTPERPWWQTARPAVPPVGFRIYP